MTGHMHITTSFEITEPLFLKVASVPMRLAATT